MPQAERESESESESASRRRLRARRRSPRRRAAKSPEEDPRRRSSGKRSPLPSLAARPSPVPDPFPALGKPRLAAKAGSFAGPQPRRKVAPVAGRATARIESTGPRSGGQGVARVVPDAGEGARNGEGCEGARREQPGVVRGA